MRILFLCHRLPYPPDKGERIRAFHELKYLGARHEVDLLCFADSQEMGEYKESCEALCRSVFVEVLNPTGRLLRAAWAGIRGASMSDGFFYSPRFARTVHQLLRQRTYDLIFVYCSSMGQFIPDATPVPIVADFVDADSAKWAQYSRECRPPRSWLYRREARAVAATELNLGSRAVLSLTTTAHDAKELCGPDAGRFPVEIMSNGVEITESSDTRDSASIAGLRPFVVFVGTMSYRPNADAAVFFAREIFPIVRREYPGLNFVVVGRDPTRSVQCLAEIPGITVTGRVPDVYGYLRNAEASVAPFRISQGFHNKIAESLAVGTPVLATKRAAMGVGLSENEGLFTAETPDQFAEKLIWLLQNSRLLRDLRNSAATVRDLLGWETRLRKLEEQMKQAIATGNGSAAPTFRDEVFS
jgi:sugar transferase (PEP-CTERM/EpsH1 system associated)